MYAATDEMNRKQEIRNELDIKELRGQAWTREDCEAAVACGKATREEVDAFFAFVATLHARGYEPWLRGGLRCEGVLIHTFPRTAEGGYAIPSLLRGVSYCGRGMHYVDRQADSDRYYTRWIGKHQVTGQLVARTDEVYSMPGYETVWVE